MKKLEFMYFDGCPSSRQTLENLKKALSELEIHATLKLVNVKSQEQAEELAFYGSPTIRIDGADLEGRTGDYSYNCRLYEVDGKLTGTLPKEYIREKLNQQNKPHWRSGQNKTRETR